MTLPTIKNKKLIKIEKITEIAQKVKKSFEEEVNYLHEKKIKNGNNSPHNTYSLS